ncbi:hypothetical protein BGLY_1981 [Bacillus glycinifermentans]|nr:hypothetical protein BGLY_1981 [Bacillus glycinifermentans]
MNLLRDILNIKRDSAVVLTIILNGMQSCLATIKNKLKGDMNSEQERT